MLHFLWLILKIILAIIGVVLALALVILLLVLFCPVKYEAAALKAEETNYKDTLVTAKVSWLFRAISARFVLEERKKNFSVTVFGVSLDKLFNKGGKKKTDSAKKSGKSGAGKLSEPADDTTPEGEPGKTQEAGTSPADGDGIRAGESGGPDSIPGEQAGAAKEQGQPAAPEGREQPGNSSGGDQTQPEDTAAGQPEPAPADAQSDSSSDLPESTPSTSGESDEEPAQETSETAEKESFFEKITGRIGQIFEKLGRLKEKAEWWTDFITDERTGFALSCVLTEVKKILAHVLPRRFYGHLAFGFEDPSITGRILAAAGATLPFHKNSVELQPSFEQKNMLDADVGLKGRFYGIRFAVSAVRILINRDVWFVIKTMKHKED